MQLPTACMTWASDSVSQCLGFLFYKAQMMMQGKCLTLSLQGICCMTPKSVKASQQTDRQTARVLCANNIYHLKQFSTLVGNTTFASEARNWCSCLFLQSPSSNVGHPGGCLACGDGGADKKFQARCISTVTFSASRWLKEIQ